MADIFISYSSTDRSVVKIIAVLLEEKGWSVWWDPEIPVGQQYDTVIETELQNAGCVLVVWTKRSIASEWVKNEATAAAQEGKLVPVVLEGITLPLAFRRMECAMMPGWSGDPDHPELEKLYGAISNTLAKNAGGKPVIQKPAAPKPSLSTKDMIICAISFTVALAALWIYLQPGTQLSKGFFFGLLFLFGISMAGFITALLKMYARKKAKLMSPAMKWAGPAVAVLMILSGALFISREPAEKNITIRLFDWKKNPITQGDVKIYLPEYVRSQSVDKMGQALFTGIPARTFNSKTKIEVTSPGYAGKTFDTTLLNSKTLELTLPFTTEVFISGKIKTAAEMPIKGVEVNVDGTRYYALSITDGSYNLRLEEYTLGDEITLTTSHKDYEDKTISLIISSPSIKNQDIFLNPIAH
jgi:hypothetical protein